VDEGISIIAAAICSCVGATITGSVKSFGNVKVKTVLLLLLLRRMF
jgi:hypothetical protein